MSRACWFPPRSSACLPSFTFTPVPMTAVRALPSVHICVMSWPSATKRWSLCLHPLNLGLCPLQPTECGGSDTAPVPGALAGLAAPHPASSSAAFHKRCDPPAASSPAHGERPWWVREEHPGGRHKSRSHAGHETQLSHQVTAAQSTQRQVK